MACVVSGKVTARRQSDGAESASARQGVISINPAFLNVAREVWPLCSKNLSVEKLQCAASS